MTRPGTRDAGHAAVSIDGAEATMEHEAAGRRAQIRVSLEQSRVVFHELLGTLKEEDLRVKRPDSGWTVRDVATHIISSLEHTPVLMGGLRRGHNHLNLPLWIAEPVKRVYTWRGPAGQPWRPLHDASTRHIRGFWRSWTRSGRTSGRGADTPMARATGPSSTHSTTSAATWRSASCKSGGFRAGHGSRGRRDSGRNGGRGGDGPVSRLRFRRRFAMIAILVGLVSIPTSLALFRPNLPAGASLPLSALPFLLGLKTFEGLALGTGIAFLIFGYPLLKRAGQLRTLTLLAFFAIGWYLVTWWPHDNRHLISGIHYIWGLLAIEYGFHFTMMVAAGALAFLYRVIRSALEEPGVVVDDPSTAGELQVRGDRQGSSR